MPSSRGHARGAGAVEAQGYLDKAREFLRAAGDSLELGNYTAAVGNAVHAGIAAADAISAARARTVWRGELRIPGVFVHRFRKFSYTDSGVFVHRLGGW